MISNFIKKYRYLALMLSLSFLLFAYLATFSQKITTIKDQCIVLELKLTDHLNTSKDTLAILLSLKENINIKKSATLIGKLTRMTTTLEGRTTLLNSQGLCPIISAGYLIFNNSKSVDTDTLILEKVNSIWDLYSENLIEIAKYNNTLLKQKAKILSRTIKYGKLYQYRLNELNKHIMANYEDVNTYYVISKRITITLFSLLLISLFTYIVFRKMTASAMDFSVAWSEIQLDENLNSADVGLLQLDLGFVTDFQNRRVIDKIFNGQDYFGFSFLDLLEAIVDKKTLQRTRKYLALLNVVETNAKILQDINPLKKVDIRITENNGNPPREQAQFLFRRELHQGEVKRVLVYIKAIKYSVPPEKVKQAVQKKHVLPRKHKTSNNPNMAKLAARVLEADGSIVEDFIEESIPALEELLGLLRQPTEAQDRLTECLDSTCRTIHKIKGDAAMLRFDEVVELLHKFEDRLTPLQHKSSLYKSDFVGFESKIADIISSLQKVSIIIKRVNSSDRRKDKTGDRRKNDGNDNNISVIDESRNTKAGSRRETNTNNHQLFQHLQSYANKISEENKKSIQLFDEGFSQAEIPKKLQKVVLSMVVQLVRNSVIHGIENEEERKFVQKRPYGSIHIGLKKRAGCFTVTVRDDGGGLNLDKIKQVAIKSGKYTQTEIDSYSNEQLHNLIMQPGFSTANKVDEHAGRGIGLDLVNTTVKDLGGKLYTRTSEGNFTEFAMIFPS